MSNRSFQQQGEQPSRVKIQVQCINCRAQQWISGLQALNKAASTIRWGCPHCHFNNQTRHPKKA